MRTAAIKRDFIAQDCLIRGDWAAENERHSHNYWAGLRLQGVSLNRPGYHHRLER